MQRTRKYFDTTSLVNKNVLLSFMEDESVALYFCASECVNPIQNDECVVPMMKPSNFVIC